MKLDQKKQVNRLVIYFFYDADGIVDRYVPYMLEDVKKNCSELFVVCNGKLTPEGRETFQQFTPNIMVRENVGFDVWAYKEALEHYGWDKLAEYDEVVLMNYTIMGPLYPFAEMFEKMNKRDLDFWGITKHHKVDFDCFETCKYKYIPEHIQSSFLVIRQSLLQSDKYQTMWQKMPMIHSYAESVGFYEAIFTKDFTDFGFKSDVYVDTTDLEGYTRYPLMMMADELIINRHCPVIKVKSFSQDYRDILGDTVGNCTVDAFNYIKNNCDYDIDLIWEHIIRTANMADIKRLMHLNYILPDEYVQKKPQTPAKKIALIMHLFYPELINESFGYAATMPEGSDLIITVASKDMQAAVKQKSKQLSQFNQVKVILIENRGRDVSALLVGCKQFVNNYDLVCFIHDKKTTQIKPYCIGRSFAYQCLENNLSSKAYVENIISTFEVNPRMGLLTPPPPIHGSYYALLGSEWYSNYDNTIKLAEKLKLNVNIHWTREPIAPLGTMFWFRPKALNKLFAYDWAYDDFPKEPNAYDGTLLHAVERIYPFVAQDAGFYSAWVMTNRFARIELTNICYMLRNTNLALSQISVNGMYLSKKQKIKKVLKIIMPKSIWEFMRKTYHLFGGKKWVG